MPTKFSTLDITEQSSHYLLTNNLSITHPISIKNSLNLPVNIQDLQCYVAEYFVYKRFDIQFEAIISGKRSAYFHNVY